jgi:hypothetical protein
MTEPNPPFAPFASPGAIPSRGPSLVPLPLEEARERAVRLLSDGYAYDKLSETEFEWRLGRLSTMDSPAAVDALVADLVAPPTPAAASVTVTEDEGRIVAVMSQTRREGPWTVPRQLRVLALMSEVRIDLRNAAIPDGCTIEISSIMANVKLVVPPDLSVDFDVTPVMASVENEAADHGAPAWGAPRLRIRGMALMAEVRVEVRLDANLARR